MGTSESRFTKRLLRVKVIKPPLRVEVKSWSLVKKLEIKIVLPSREQEGVFSTDSRTIWQLKPSSMKLRLSGMTSLILLLVLRIPLNLTLT